VTRELQTIYYVDLCSDDHGEVQAMFDEDKNLIDYWWTNDGNWRSEYFNPFMNKLGFDIRHDLTDECERKLEEYLAENC
jgi:hypothetical protein